jgi:hypothetical protein
MSELDNAAQHLLSRQHRHAANRTRWVVQGGGRVLFLYARGRWTVAHSGMVVAALGPGVRYTRATSGPEIAMRDARDERVTGMGPT